MFYNWVDNIFVYVLVNRLYVLDAHGVAAADVVDSCLPECQSARSNVLLQNFEEHGC